MCISIRPFYGACLAKQSLVHQNEADTRVDGKDGCCKMFKNNSLHTYFALVFLQHTSFFLFRGVMEEWREERKAGWSAER